MENSVFDRLISDLTSEERKVLADKMKSGGGTSVEPLIIEENNISDNQNDTYETLSFFEKIIIFFKTLFGSMERDRIVRDYLVDKLGRSLEKQFPLLISYTDKLFKELFYKKLQELSDSLTTIRGSFVKVLKGNKMDFTAFLVGWILPDMHKRLIAEIDPYTVEKELDDPDVLDVRRECESRLEGILETLSDGDRKVLYRYFRSLHILEMLLEFDFRNCIGKFVVTAGKNEKTARFSDLRKPLISLARILVSLKYPPNEEIFKAIYHFSSDKEDLTGYMELTEQVMEKIRSFNLDIPMNGLLKILNRNIHFNSADIGGGEDWFALYKKFWYQKSDQDMNQYSKKKKIESLFIGIQNSMNINFRPLMYYRNGIWGEGFGVKYEKSSGMAYQFVSLIFLKVLSPPLKLILVDGKFYKEQNREDFNLAYSFLTRTLELIKSIDTKLAPGGEYDLEIKEVKEDYSSESEKRTEIINILQNADKEIENVLKDFIFSLDNLGKIINGITHGEIGGPYDTLSNLGYIGKGENNDLIPNLVKDKEIIDSFMKLFTQLFDLEMGVSK